MENSDYLGKEKVGKLLMKFAVPCILSLIISCLYNIVDQIFVGNSKVGYLGNAATGVIFPITVVGWGLSLFFGDDAAAILITLPIMIWVWRKLGSQEKEAAAEERFPAEN